jgi:hypothetical protein
MEIYSGLRNRTNLANLAEKFDGKTRDLNTIPFSYSQADDPRIVCF